jgi:hypothetical protein
MHLTGQDTDFTFWENSDWRFSMKSKLLGLIVTVVMTVPASAASITYSLNIQESIFSITGTITTDGTIGALQDSNVIAYDLAVTGIPDVVCLSACTADPSGTTANISGGSAATGPGLIATTNELNFDFADEYSNFIVLGNNNYPSDFVEFFDHVIASGDEGNGGIGIGGLQFVFYPNLGNLVENPDGTYVIGSVTTTPLPAALPLFAAGLGIIGLFGWRRRRRSGAPLAAA